MQVIRSNAVCGALVAAVATWAFLQFPGLLIWCAFLGWAGFLHGGGARPLMLPTVACLWFGVAMAWLFSVIITAGYLPLPLPLAAGLLVAVMAPVIISASQLPLLSIVPASFYGFAACFAFLTQSAGKFDHASLTTPASDHVLLVVPLSLAIGVGLGRLQTVLAQALMRATTTGALGEVGRHMDAN